MEKMPERIDSKYRFVLLAAARAEQLLDGALAHADHKSNKITRVAMREIMDSLVEWDYGPAPEPVEEGAEEEADEA